MKCNTLTFEAPDTHRFRNLALAYEALHQGGNMPCIVNAANEVVVASFLKDQISFLGMSDVIEKTMSRLHSLKSRLMRIMYRQMQKLVVLQPKWL